ncbi:uncharacterized protein F4822DRAFT_396859 [Hypoxylon trugodes]|uniref:uncharacterized protein n=1 Tax=Hypoxylon trugodes TaxID=326681 RepID=UPI0021A18841|nr:uncharacterized protein F4822DRAFT_396859 [Hypoxylon trugodes]KAI1391482.1 hypothetical protein F4822DRAFT_396859 [Hypoxylon trugodes]
MAPLRVLAPAAFVALASAISVSDYIPSCGTQCITDTVDQHTTCDATDNACICRETYTVKRDGEVCLRQACSTTDYGGVMSGFDNFCKAVSGEPTSSSSSSTSSPTDTPTSSSSYPSSTPSSTESSSTETGSSSSYPTETASSSSGSSYPTSSGSQSSGTGYPSSSGGATGYPTSTGGSSPSGPSSGLPSPSSSTTATPSPIPGSAATRADARVGASIAALLLASGFAYFAL